MPARKMVVLGEWSQFSAPVEMLYRMAYQVEAGIKPRNADNCFVVAMIGKKPEGRKSEIGKDAGGDKKREVGGSEVSHRSREHIPSEVYLPVVGG